MLSGFRCKDCNDLLNQQESEFYFMYDGLCENCFDKDIEAKRNIIPEEFFDDYDLEP